MLNSTKKLILLSLFFVPALYGQPKDTKDNTAITQKQLAMLRELDYEQLWIKVDEFEKSGRTKSADTIAGIIYVKAEKEAENQQMLKSLLVKFSYKSIIDENNTESIVRELRQKISASRPPYKNLLNCLLAGTYREYYNNNRYKNSERSEISDSAGAEDFTAWSNGKIRKEILNLYLQSLENTELLRNINLEAYRDIVISKREDVRLSNFTLFDLLALTALDYFDEPNYYYTIRDNKKAADITDAAYFSPAAEFCSLQISGIDTLSDKYQALRIFQLLTAAHIDTLSRNYSKASLTQIDAMRLNYVYRNSGHNDKDSLYVNSLKRAASIAGSTDSTSAVYLFKLAEYYCDKSEMVSSAKRESRYIHRALSIYDDGYIPDYLLDWLKKTRKSGEIDPRAKALAICQEILGRFPGIPEAIPLKSLQEEILQRVISAEMPENVAPGMPFSALFSYVNVTNLRVHIIPLNGRNEYMLKKDSLSLKKVLAVTENSRFFSFDFKPEPDYLPHSVELPFPALPAGRYALLAECSTGDTLNDANSTRKFFRATRFSFITRQAEKMNTVLAADRATGHPLANTEIRVYSDKWNPGLKKHTRQMNYQLKTGEDGIIVFPKKSGIIYELEAAENSDTLRQKMSDYSASDFRGSSEEEKCFIFTDRSLYRPAQKIFFKGLIIYTDRDAKKSRPAVGRLIKAELRDPNKTTVSTLDLTANEFGSFSGEFQIPAGQLNGNWSICCLGSTIATIRVEEYKRPQFTISLDPASGSYILNDTVRVSGKAAAYNGVPLTSVKVKYNVTSQGDSVAAGETETDKAGCFEINFPAFVQDTTGSAGVFCFTVNTAITDASGETQEAGITVNAGSQRVYLSSDIADVENSETFRTLKITVKNVNSQPAEANVRAVICRLKKPPYTLITRLWEKPDRQLETGEKNITDLLPVGQDYEDNYPYTSWDIADTVFQKDLKIKGDSVVALDNEYFWQPGKYILELISEDERHKIPGVIRYFDLFNPSTQEAPANIPLWSNPVSSDVKAGSAVKLLLGTSLDSLHVLCALEYRGRIIERKWLKLGKGQRVIEFQSDGSYNEMAVIHILSVYENRSYIRSHTISFQEPDRNLLISFETFRNKLNPGNHETWRLKVRMPDGTPIRAELLASMYDKSLDVLWPHKWAFNPYPQNHYRENISWDTEVSFSLLRGEYISIDIRLNSIPYALPALNYFDYSLYDKYYPGSLPKSRKYTRKLYGTTNVLYGTQSGMDYSLIEVTEKKEEGDVKFLPPVVKYDEQIVDGVNLPDQSFIRKNLQETAFFYPHILTDSLGEASVSFTVPEALSTWKFMAFAHTKDMRYGQVKNEVITQKQLMVQANPPRFLREGDTLYFTARISSLSEKTIEGKVRLEILNAATGMPADGLVKNSSSIQEFAVSRGSIHSAAWKLIIPCDSLQLVTWRITAAGGGFSDGEENTLPVLKNSQLITEAMPVEISANQSGDFKFGHLAEYDSSALRHQSLTFEFTSNPVWYAVLALPYMMEFPYECSEQTFSRYFANSLASHILNSDPRIRQVIGEWRARGSRALKSSLENNAELKSILLRETPWVRDARNETEARDRIAQLMDPDKLAAEQKACLNKLIKAQLPEGAWPWFEGMYASPYITQHIIAGFGHLNRLKVFEVSKNPVLAGMLKKAVEYCDRRMYEEYKELINSRTPADRYYAGRDIIHYMYARSYFGDMPLKAEHKKAFAFWHRLIKDRWLSTGKYCQALTALTAKRAGDDQLAGKIVTSLQENSIVTPGLGMYFKNNYAYSWDDSPVETQALMIEAFNEISHDTLSIELMKKWLLKQKKTASWATTKATAEACYALLMCGNNWMAENKQPVIKVGKEELNLQDISAETGTGYIKKIWNGSQITKDMAVVHIENKNAVPAYGALYWQYFGQLDKLDSAGSSLRLKKELFLETQEGNRKPLIPVTESTVLKPGDLLRVRIVVKSDRDMEYIHMKDMRASGFEPVNVLSSYKYQDGLWYYESTKDAATNFFIEYMPKGTYVFEYPLRVAYKGGFSNGITNIQSMYAPELTGHSNGLRVQVK